MAAAAPSIQPNRSIGLVNAFSLLATGTFVSDEISVARDLSTLAVQATFVRAAGGGTCDVFLQTSLDKGDTWVDIAQWAFTTSSATRIHAVRSSIALAANYTPTDGSLSDNTIKDGLMGDRLRVKTIIAGTSYTGSSTLNVDLVINQ
jgi:hypothetical protein